MTLTPTERQTLLGPLVAGCVLGAVVALAVLGFDNEYRHLAPWSLEMALDAGIAFVASVALVVVPLGLLPIAVGRLRALR